jgi:Lipid A 3-O-deacylase (PagL)
MLSMVLPLVFWGPARAQASAGAADVIPGAERAQSMPKWMPYGGVHEFGVSGGLSWVSGPIWGYRTQVHYAPIELRYSYLMVARQHLTARYSPEVTAPAWLDEPVLDDNNNVIGRSHTFGGGFSPLGFQVDFRPSHRVQPFWANNAGFLYFANRVLSPQGSQLMYMVDFGGGVNIHMQRHRAMTIGYRYQHLSNANISQHNPGTDAGTFYLGFSQFHTHGVK